MNKPVSPPPVTRGEEHWTTKGKNVRLFLWNKYARDPSAAIGRILFVHGSSMASQPTFDLQVPGGTYISAMEFFARRGYDTWCVDVEGYGRSTKDRDNNAPIACGADDCFAAASYIQTVRGKEPLLIYGISSGALLQLYLRKDIQTWLRGSRSMRWCGPAKTRRPCPNAASACRNSAPATGGLSIASLSDRSSSAIIRARQTMR
jgi:hypothetical protein